MKKEAYIWRESVYKNQFKCNKCGAKLFKADKMKLTKNVRHIDEWVFCSKCGNPVARIEVIDIDPNINGLQGLWDDYVKRTEDRQ